MKSKVEIIKKSDDKTWLFPYKISMFFKAMVTADNPITLENKAMGK